MLTVTPHASGSAGNLYTVSDGATTLMLECGVPWKAIQRALNFRVSEVAGCLLTHSHGDHSAGVRDVLKAGVEVFTSTGTAEALGIEGHHRLRTVEPMEQFRIGSWICRGFDAVHDAAEPLNFLLASGTEKLCYITDSAYCRYRFQGISHLLVECNHSVEILRRNVEDGVISVDLKNRILRSHMALERLIEFLRANDLSRVQQITLIHVSDANGDEAGFKLAVQRATGKMVCVAPARGVI